MEVVNTITSSHASMQAVQPMARFHRDGDGSHEIFRDALAVYLGADLVQKATVGLETEQGIFAPMRHVDQTP